MPRRYADDFVASDFVASAPASPSPSPARGAYDGAAAAPAPAADGEATGHVTLECFAQIQRRATLGGEGRQDGGAAAAAVDAESSDWIESPRAAAAMPSAATAAAIPSEAKEAKRYWLARHAAEGAAPPSVTTPGRGLCVALASHAFEPSEFQEMGLAAGDRVHVLRDEFDQPGVAWVFAAAVAAGGASGYVPRQYLAGTD